MQAAHIGNFMSASAAVSVLMRHEHGHISADLPHGETLYRWETELEWIAARGVRDDAEPTTC